MRGNALAIAVAAGLVALAVPAPPASAQDDPEVDAEVNADPDPDPDPDPELEAAAAPARPRVSDERIERARARALTPAYQPTLPRYAPAAADNDKTAGAAGPAAPSRRADRPAAEPVERDRERRPAAAARSQPLDLDDGSSTVLTVLLWGLVAVVLALVAIWLARELWPRRDPELAADAPEPAGPAETAAVIDRPLGDADELAGRGAYAEAIHALLLRTLGELARTAAVRVERSHTSREILARVPLQPDARDALAGLITAVEVTHFGDAPATADDYGRCREQFHRFAAAFRAGGLAPRRRPPGAAPAEEAAPA